MPIQVIVEFTAKPGKRADLHRALETLIASMGPGLKGYLGSKRYEVVGQPDLLVEVADWESAEAREAHLAHARATNAFAPLLELMGGPFRATILKPL